jgi:hypothetical protein
MNYLKVLNARGVELNDVVLKDLGIEITMPKLVVTVVTEDEDNGLIVDSVYDNRICDEWTYSKLKEKGLNNTFTDKEDLKECLNWYLDGDSSKYKIKVKDKDKKTKKTTYTCFIYD